MENTYDLPIVAYCNYVTILHLLRDTASYWSKMVTLKLVLYLTPPLEMIPSEFRNSDYYNHV